MDNVSDLHQIYKDNGISYDVYFDSLQRSGLIDRSVDIEVEKSRLSGE